MELLVDSSASFGQVVIGALDEVFGTLESERFLHGGASGIHQALGCHIDQVKRIKAAARFANMPGLQWVCSLIERNLITFYNQNRLLSDDENSLLGEWPELLASYALNQSDCKIDALTRYVAASTWPAPLNTADIEEMRHLLACDPMEATQNNEESTGLFLVPDPTSSQDVVAQLRPPIYSLKLNAVVEIALDSKDAIQDEAIIVNNVPDDMPDPMLALHDALDMLIVTSAADIETDTSDGDMLLQYAAQLDVLSLYAAEAGLAELATTCSAFTQIMNQRTLVDRCITDDERGRLNLFPMMVMEIIADPENDAANSALMEFVLDPVWDNSAFNSMQDTTLETKTDPLSNALLSEPASVESLDAMQPSIDCDSYETNPVLPDLTNSNCSFTSVANSSPDLMHESAPDVQEQHIGRDMLDLLAKELGLMNVQMATDLAAVVDPEISKDARHEALSNYVDVLARIGATAETVGLPALKGVLNQLMRLTSSLTDEVNPDQAQLLSHLPDKLATYLSEPSDESKCIELLAILVDPAWPLPMEADSVIAWVQALANVTMLEMSNFVEDETKKIVVASDRDVSIALPHDINLELLEGLLQELPIQVNSFSMAIGRFASGNGTMVDVEQAKRAAHTLKGAANTVGVAGIANLTHHLEDLLIGISNENTLPGKSLIALLVEASDCLEAMSEAVMESDATPIQARGVLQKVLDYANHVAPATQDDEQIPASFKSDIQILSEAVDAGQDGAESNLEATPESADSTAPTVGQILRVPALVVDELLRLAGENVISNAQIQERLRQTQKQSKSNLKQDSLLQKLIAELETLVDVRGIAAPRKSNTQDGDFDPLEFERFSELHTITSQLIEATTDAREMSGQVDEQLNALGELLEVQRRLQMENQHAVIRTRLVPVSTIVSRLQRSVRQTCRLLNKQVELKIIGEATSIDSNMLHDLTDPLMHVLRNAVDHGIESTDIRAARDKSAVAKIELSFAREGNSIVVRCKDDGAGLDYAAIRLIAIQRNMIAPDRIVSDEELGRFILIPGFSTKESTTQTSGRGIGMDAVHSSILEMKGSLNLRSSAGAGLTVELRLPATLLSEHTLMTRIGGKLLAISSRRILDIHYITPDQIDSIGNEQVYRVGDVVHRLLRLETLLDLPGNPNEANQLGFPILITDTDSGVPCAILVHELVDGREVVVKKLGRYVPKIQGTIGAVILGDGSVAPVIDLPELLRSTSVQGQSRKAMRSVISANDNLLAEAPRNVTRTALIVDDSLTARREAARIMRDAGYEVRT
ncbi:MAG: Hpt domain-containing protein, partial [Pseudomonadota bacterium]